MCVKRALPLTNEKIALVERHHPDLVARWRRDPAKYMWPLLVQVGSEILDQEHQERTP